MSTMPELLPTSELSTWQTSCCSLRKEGDGAIDDIVVTQQTRRSGVGSESSRTGGPPSSSVCQRGSLGLLRELRGRGVSQPRVRSLVDRVEPRPAGAYACMVPSGSRQAGRLRTE